MQRMSTCLMFIGEQYGKAEEATDLYVSVFDDSRVLDVERFAAEDDDSGIKLASFKLARRRFLEMDSGFAHKFTFTPAMSLFVDCDGEEQLDAAFEGLSAGAKILMPLGACPFSSSSPGSRTDSGSPGSSTWPGGELIAPLTGAPDVRACWIGPQLE